LPFSPNSGPVRGAYRAAACSGNRRRTLFVISLLALVFVAGDANALGPVEIEVAAKGGGGYLRASKDEQRLSPEAQRSVIKVETIAPKGGVSIIALSPLRR
jgi:hypothetical protein